MQNCGLGYLLLVGIFASCVGTGKFKKLQAEHATAKINWEKSRENYELTNSALSNQNLDLNSKLLHQNTLLSQILNDKMNLEKEVNTLKDEISLLRSESKSLEAGLNEELKQKNENLKGKEAKLNQMINWQLQQEANLKDISTKLGEKMTGYSENEVEWFYSEHQLSIVLYRDFILENDRALTNQGIQALEKLGSILKEFPSLQVALVGHTDNSVNGVRETLEISTKRALLAGTYLLDEAGINGNQITISGQGGYYPRVSNQTPAGRALNNRVEVIVQSPVRQLWMLLEK